MNMNMSILMNSVIMNVNSNLAVHCIGDSKKNVNNNIIKSLGWFAKTKSIIKFLNEGRARCFQCYESVIYEEIAYSRIINNYNKDKDNRNDNRKDNRKDNKDKDNKDKDNISKRIKSLDQLSIFESLYKIAALCYKCIGCCDENFNIKFAPRGYGDIISDLLLAERFDILANDIEKISDAKLKGLLDKINYSLFNYNEKLLIHTALVSENEKLKNNLELEIEKHKILCDHKSKNQEMQNDIKNYLLKSTKTIFAEYEKVIDKQISKYNDLNCAVKYNIPECKVCMMREVRLALECGHLLCIDCNKNILEEQQKQQNDLDIDEQVKNELCECKGYPCPFCKTYSSKFLQIYL